MGIVNVTPDSFSDGGSHDDTRSALEHCEQLLRDGAHILDIGGESTRPGAPPVGRDEELARVLPVVRGAARLGVPISVDTYKPEVMRAVLDAGADIINDVWALRRGDGIDAVCMHHMRIRPQKRTDEFSPKPGPNRHGDDQRKHREGDADHGNPGHDGDSALGPFGAQVAPGDHAFKT